MAEKKLTLKEQVEQLKNALALAEKEINLLKETDHRIVHASAAGAVGNLLEDNQALRNVLHEIAHLPGRHESTTKVSELRKLAFEALQRIGKR